MNKNFTSRASFLSPVVLSFRTGLPGQITYGVGGRKPYTLAGKYWPAETKANLLVLVGQKYCACSHRGSKSQAVLMLIAKKNRKLGGFCLNFSGQEPGPRPTWRMQPREMSFLRFPPPGSSSCSGEGSTAIETWCGAGIFSIFLSSIFISVHASAPHRILLIALKGKHLLGGTELSRLSMVTAGVCDYLMGLADYEKACFTVGFLRGEK